MTRAVELERRDSIARITLNRPDHGNAVDLELARSLRSVVTELTDDLTVRAVILQGSGDRFCVGGDLNSFAAHRDDLSLHLRDVVTELHLAIRGLSSMGTPVITGVQGAAAGAGLALVLASDIVVAAESSSFRTAYTALGLSPDGGTSWNLPRLVGLQRALDLAMTNRVLDATEAACWGIVSRVVDDGDVRATVHDIATSLTKLPSDGLRATKRLVRRSFQASLEGQLDSEALALFGTSRTPEVNQRIESFVRGERR